MATPFRYELAVAVLLTVVALSLADPMILLTNTQAKCMTVEAPADSLLTIDYEAPDLVLPEDLSGGDRDPRTARRFRTTITVSQDNARENHHGHRQRSEREASGKVVKDLEKKKGTIDYVTSADGAVSICVQCLTATAVSPAPISLRVSESPAGEYQLGGGGDAAAGEKASAGAGPKVDEASQKNAHEHFSQMERTLSGLISKTDMILRQADYAKELEVEFHEQSIAMNKASQWWPIVQLCVLLVTGFTQANHMVAFFKKHHIF